MSQQSSIIITDAPNTTLVSKVFNLSTLRSAFSWLTVISENVAVATVVISGLDAFIVGYLQSHNLMELNYPKIIADTYRRWKLICATFAGTFVFNGAARFVEHVINRRKSRKAAPKGANKATKVEPNTPSFESELGQD